MREISRVLVLASALVCGCSPPQPSTPAVAAPSSVAPVLNLKQFMEWVVDPAADVIWDSVKTITTEAGVKEIAPQTDDQWNAVRNAAATLTETGNMLMADGRARDDKQWMVAAKMLTANSEKALKAAQAKNTADLFAAGGEIYGVCAACHGKYAPHLNSSAPLAPVAASTRANIRVAAR
jgi:hypothetical protein